MNASLVDQMATLPRPTVPPSMPTLQRSPPFKRSIDLAALPTAILCTRLFVASTLQRWGARFIEADAEVLAVELVRHSVQACGVMDEYVRLSALDYVNVIQVQLLGFEQSIGIEVWDNATEPALGSEYKQGDELNGLALVDARAKEWGSCVTPQGRVTWAELHVYERTSVGLPIRTSRPTPYRHSAANAKDHPSQNAEFLRRLRDGLNRL
jgi:hypothetical protein